MRQYVQKLEIFWTKDEPKYIICVCMVLEDIGNQWSETWQKKFAQGYTQTKLELDQMKTL